MVEPLPSEIATRLSRLESTIKRDRIISLAVIAFVLVGANAMATSQKPASRVPITIRNAAGVSATLTANGLTIRDAKGQERAFYGLDDAGRPDIDLSDSHGNLRESLYLLHDTPVLRQFDANGNRRLDITADSTGAGEVLLFDSKENTRMALFTTQSGDPEFALYGTDQKLRAYLGTDDISPFLVMRDAGQTDRVTIGGYTDQTWGMDIRDPNNTTLWKAP